MSFLNWLDHRTGIRPLVHAALYESIPGGARWRYVWGSTLVFAFFVQVVTGLFLWMFYSPSAQTAWESVYYIQYQLQGGWLLRGLHHFMAHAMVVLLGLHLMQVVIDGAYRAPREVNFWIGLLLMLIVLGLSLTGYLLPWDQKGYWATRVATNLAGIAPLIGTDLQQLFVGGPEYGHHTLTRFFALHAGVLPGLLIGLLVVHVALFRRHGICSKQPARRPDATFWPDQVLRDAVACLAVLAIVLLLILHFDPAGLWRGESSASQLGAELGAPADPSHPYSAARPDWYFLFLFQFLKLFEGGGEAGERLGAIYIPTIILAVLFLMPIVGRWKWGHRFNVAFVAVLLGGVCGLTGAALWEDHQARWTDGAAFGEIAELSRELGTDDQKIAAHFGRDSAKAAAYRRDLKRYQAYRKSQQFLLAKREAEAAARRAVLLAGGSNQIPPAGALALLRQDAFTQGPRLFAQHCASCHSYFKPDDLASFESKEQLSRATAPNLYGFGSRQWIAGLLNPKKITGPEYFGSTTRYRQLKTEGKSMEMVDYVLGDVSEWPPEELEQVVAALSAQAQLPAQAKQDADDRGLIEAGANLIADTSRCAGCHRFEPTLAASDPQLAENETGYPDLTHYGSRDWVIGMICNPAAPRFYGERNDRMPAYAPASARGETTILTRREVEFLADWLRKDDRASASRQ